MAADRVSIKTLEAIVARINRMTGSPMEPYTRGPRGLVANVGNYHLSGAYGGYALHRMSNDGGGVSDVLRSGHVPKRELRDLMFAFIEGLERGALAFAEGDVTMREVHNG